ncbi:type II toxin-antitoxin system RelB/DinJ family antitoxin [Candidatus Saccharibacteria bacterium]|nr:type II toxin-antitoxin system RelB/DinJ family antitoxin [Candidatus Saccharibacteria bacterium]
MSNTTKSKTTTNLIQVRIPDEIKQNTAKICAENGISTSDFLRMAVAKLNRTRSIAFVAGGSYPITPSQTVNEVITNFEIEDMPVTERNIRDLTEIELGLTTPEVVRDRILKEIKERHNH